MSRSCSEEMRPSCLGSLWTVQNARRIGIPLEKSACGTRTTPSKIGGYSKMVCWLSWGLLRRTFSGKHGGVKLASGSDHPLATVSPLGSLSLAQPEEHD